MTQRVLKGIKGKSPWDLLRSEIGTETQKWFFWDRSGFQNWDTNSTRG